MTSTYYQPKLGQYDFYKVVSALRKTIKLGQKEDAIYWLHVLVTLSDSGAKTAAKQLWIMAGEDIADEMVVLRPWTSTLHKVHEQRKRTPKRPINLLWCGYRDSNPSSLRLARLLDSFFLMRSSAKGIVSKSNK
jgi:hypothetical protein